MPLTDAIARLAQLLAADGRKDFAADLMQRVYPHPTRQVDPPLRSRIQYAIAGYYLQSKLTHDEYSILNDAFDHDYLAAAQALVAMGPPPDPHNTFRHSDALEYIHAFEGGLKSGSVAAVERCLTDLRAGITQTQRHNPDQPVASFVLAMLRGYENALALMQGQLDLDALVTLDPNE